MKHIGDIRLRDGRAVFERVEDGADISPAPQYGGAKVRTAVRAVVFDAAGNIACISVKDGKHHKNPGGGVDAGEDLTRALAREVDEEAGASVRIDGELGVIVQYDEHDIPFHVSFGYVCTVVGPVRERHLTEKEISERFTLGWLPIDDAIRALEGEQHDDDVLSDSIRVRELAFLRKAERLDNK